MADPTSPVLEPGDLNSATWLRIKAHFEQRLADHRAKNDNGTLDPIKTARLRGRIAEAKQVLALGSPIALMEEDKSD